MNGGVRKRGENWYYYFDASKVDGKRKRIERVGGKTKKDAQAALRKALLEYERAGLHFEPSEISVSDYMDHWFKNYVMLNCKYHTQTCYRAIIENHVKPALGIYKLKALTPTVLQEFINGKYLYGYSKSQLTNIQSLLSGSLKQAVHPYKYINDNPMQYVKLPKYEHSRTETNHKLITNSEFKKIISRFPFGSNFHIPLLIGYYTGMRIGEVMGLTWEDVDLDKGTIEVNRIIYKRGKNWYFGSTKTASSVRTVKIGKTLTDALKKWKVQQMKNRMKYGNQYIQQYEIEEAMENEKLRRIVTLSLTIDPGAMQPIHMVSTKDNGEIITTESFKYAARVIHYELGIVFNFHSLRHTHATTLIENGANIKDVQERLGHAFIETTLGTYTHSTEKAAAQSVDIFEDAAK